MRTSACRAAALEGAGDGQGAETLTRGCSRRSTAPDFAMRATAARADRRRASPTAARRLAGGLRARRRATRSIRRARRRARGAGEVRRRRGQATSCAGRWPTASGRCACVPPSCCSDAGRDRRRSRCGRRRCGSRVDFFESAALLHPTYSPHAFIETAPRHDRDRAERRRRAGHRRRRSSSWRAPVSSTASASIASCRTSSFRPAIRAATARAVRATRCATSSARLPFVRGTVGMALDGRDTGGSQFFITLSPQPHLDGKYTVFGRVVNGWDVLDRIDAVGRDRARADLGRGQIRRREVRPFGLRIVSASWSAELARVDRTKRQKKRGRQSPPFLVMRAGELTASCRPSSSRPWLLSSPLCLSPLSLWCAAQASTAPRRRCLPARRPRAQRPRFVAGPSRGASRARRSTTRACACKKKGAAVAAHPLHARSRSFVRVPNKWAELSRSHARCRLWTSRNQCQAQSRVGLSKRRRLTCSST